jgi:alginate O-acetyltransferase complex protein AlgI
MLFNSPSFIFGFLPVALAGFFILGRFGLRQMAVLWIVVASLIFYSWDDPRRLAPLIVGSIIFNYFFGLSLARRHSRRLLFLAVAGNLALLGYFKYTTFLLDTLRFLTNLPIPVVAISLPIGISFYTFTQIAFLVDSYRKEAREYNLLKYGAFVTYYPHLVAGPIIHHKEIMPQFDSAIYLPQLSCIAQGLSWFVIGLFKKVVFADNVGIFVDSVFKAAASGSAVGFADAWMGTVSYALQIYFDFSGYSDMAIGLALLMGIRFPINFNSPYKADSLIEFWRRWHMTLSRFLRDYLYIPLGGNKKGPGRRYLNLLVTMLLGGLWHGASWNFAVWGAIHGIGLAINWFWRGTQIRLPLPISWILTSLLVIVAWVPFRADTLGSSIVIWKAMAGLSTAASASLPLEYALYWIAGLSFIAVAAPNSQEIFFATARLRWKPNLPWAMALGCMFGLAVASSMAKPTTFLYFRF